MAHLKILEGRVLALEHDTQEMRDNMERLSEDVQLLHATIKQMDERTIRGERLMMEMQGEQRQQSKVLSEIAAHLLPPTKPGV